MTVEQELQELRNQVHELKAQMVEAMARTEALLTIAETAAATSRQQELELGTKH